MCLYFSITHTQETGRKYINNLSRMGDGGITDDFFSKFATFNFFFISKTLHNERKVKVKAAQSCPTLCNPRIIQVRTLEWVAFPFSRGASQPRDQTQVAPITGGFFTSWVTIPHTNSICNRKTSLFKCSITCDYNYKLCFWTFINLLFLRDIFYASVLCIF